MAPKLFLVIFLMTLSFHSIQNDLQTFQGFFLYPEMKPSTEIKEVKATLRGEFLPVFKGSMADMVEEEVSSEEMVLVESDEEEMATNRLKRETGSEDLNKTAKASREVQNPKAQGVETSKQAASKEADKAKRQTSIKGNGNRLSNLINLPIRLNVLANVLSQLNLGVIDPKEKPLSSNSISGNDNTVSSLVNAPIDVDAIVNVLSKVDRAKLSSSDVSNKGGVVENVLASLLGGDSEKGQKGLVDGLLGGLLGDDSGSGLLGSVLGDTLGDLLAALLGNDGLVGNLLGGVEGKDFITELLDNLLGGVTDLVDSLLDLLVGILEGLLHGLDISNAATADPDSTEPSGSATGSQRLNIHGNNNSVSSLINAPVRVNALINILTSLKQEIRQQVEPAVSSGIKRTSIQGNNNELSTLVNLPADLDLKVNLLSSLVEKPLSIISGGERDALLPVLPGSSPADSSSARFFSPVPSLSGPSLSAVPNVNAPSLADSHSTNIEGNNNIVSSLLNVVPDVNLHLNLLSEITNLLGDNSDSNVSAKNTSKGIHEGNNPNEICFDIPISQVDTSVTGDNNKISNAVNIKPKINIDLNLLSNVKQSGDSSVPTQRVCITRPAQPPKPSLPHIPAPPHPTPPKPKPTLPAPSKPELPKPAHSLPAPPLPVPLIPSSPSEICFDVLVDQSGTVVSGNNNRITSLINADPKINLDLNLLSNVRQSSPQSNLMVKRICIPRQTISTPAPTFRPTEAPLYPRADTRCFRRTCTKWRQFVDYNCVNKPNEYPKITYTSDI